MKGFSKLLLFLSLALLVSCATSRQLTREDWQNVAQRKYSNIEKAKVLSAAESVMKLLDGNDFSFGHTADGINGQRRYMIYAILAYTAGTDHWTINTSEKDGHVIASLQLSRQSSDMIATGSTAGIVTSPTLGSPAMETASYDLFWRRVDYILGLTDQWTTCSDQKENIKTNKAVWGNITFMCDLGIADNFPENLSEKEMDRIFKNKYYQKWAYIKKRDPARWEAEAAKNSNIRMYER